MVSRSLVFVALLTSATPAWAQEAAAVSGVSHATLFALGLLGLYIGRRAAMRDTDQD